jgi:hypothetical protein
MAILDQIAQQRQRISERLTRVDAERTKLNGRLGELEVTERALKRFGGNGVAAVKPEKVRVAKAAKAASTKAKADNTQQAKGTSLGDATLKAVKAHAKGANTDQLRGYLSRKFGLTVRPNHLGSALQRHRRAGRLETRNQRWYLAATV